MTLRHHSPMLGGEASAERRDACYRDVERRSAVGCGNSCPGAAADAGAGSYDQAGLPQRLPKRLLRCPHGRVRGAAVSAEQCGLGLATMPAGSQRDKRRQLGQHDRPKHGCRFGADVDAITDPFVSTCATADVAKTADDGSARRLRLRFPPLLLRYPARRRPCNRLPLRAWSGAIPSLSGRSARSLERCSADWNRQGGLRNAPGV